MRLPVALLLTLLATGCASTGAVPAPFPQPAPEPRPALGVDLALPPGESPLPPIVGTAMSLRGVPYRNGGSDPTGFDCSGFVSYVFAQQGLLVPRTVAEQFDAGRGVVADAVAPGDLIFFSTVAPGASHVGIVVSGDLFVHAPSSSGVVRVERLSSPYWNSRFVGVRRIF